MLSIKKPANISRFFSQIFKYLCVLINNLAFYQKLILLQNIQKLKSRNLHKTTPVS
jgi:hypothetical protein